MNTHIHNLWMSSVMCENADIQLIYRVASMLNDFMCFSRRQLPDSPQESNEHNEADNSLSLGTEPSQAES